MRQIDLYRMHAEIGDRSEVAEATAKIDWFEPLLGLCASCQNTQFHLAHKLLRLVRGIGQMPERKFGDFPQQHNLMWPRQALRNTHSATYDVTGAHLCPRFALVLVAVSQWISTHGRLSA